MQYATFDSAMTTDLTADDAEFDCEVQDGKIIAPTSALEGWDDNPRESTEGDIDRLCQMLEDLGQFKPLLVEPDGTVIGGNMRIQALAELGWDSAWVSLIEPEDEDERIEYALADNDRVGHYTEEAVAGLITDRDIDITKYKPDFYEPTDFSQNMARAMDGESVLELTGGRSDDGEESEGSDTTRDRSVENVDTETTTEMIQLYMTGDVKRQIMAHAKELKKVYGVETTSDVVEHAVAEAYEHNCADEEDGDVPDEVMADGGE